jgi:membrane protease subunit HflK
MKADYQSYARATRISLLGLAIQVLLGAGLLVYSVLGRDYGAFGGSVVILIGSLGWIVLAIVFDQHRRERVEAMENEALDARGDSSVFDASASANTIAARRLAWMHSWLVPGVSVAMAAALIGFGYWRFMQLSGATFVYTPDGGTQAIDPFILPLHRGWAIAVGLVIAFIGFIFARFVSGMARQRAWSNLRAGAAGSVLASLIGVTIVVAQFVHVGGSDMALRWVQLGIPLAGALVGAEIIVSLLLNLYRPRRAGELPRPAFDSPVLAFVSAPDELAKSIGGAISYQVGVDVTGSWAWVLVRRAVLPLVVFGLGVLWLLTSVSVVQTNEQGIRLRFGSPVLSDAAGSGASGAGDTGGTGGVAAIRPVEVLEPGLHFKLPWPLEVIETAEVSPIRRIDLATSPPGNVPAVLWTNDHMAQEVYMIMQASVLRTGAGDGGRPGTVADVKAGASGGTAGGARDIAYLAVEIPLRWRIKDLRTFEQFASPGSREALIRAVAQREATRLFATKTDADVLGAGATKVSAELAQAINAALERVWTDPVTGQGVGTGVEVVSVGIEGVHPSQEAAPFYEQVVSNEQLRKMYIQRGESDKIAKLTEAVGNRVLAERIVALIDERDRLAGLEGTPANVSARKAKEAEIEALIVTAGGKAGAKLAQARAERWNRSQRERGRALAYAGLLGAYQANPQLFMASQYMQMFREEVADARVYVVPPDVLGNLWVNIDLKDVGSGASPFASPTANP